MAAGATCTKIEGTKCLSSALIYVNGINTTKEVAEATAKMISTKIGCTVLSCHNNCTSIGQILKITGQLLVPSPALAAEYSSIQDCKKKKAEAIFVEVKKNLPQYGRVVLLGHSQGAHIVEELLGFLSPDQKDQVRALTLGGMVAIEGVDNFVFKDDWVAQTAQLFYQSKGKVTSLEGGSHGVSDYLENKDVQAMIGMHLGL